MNILKKVLMGLGGFFFLLILLIIFLAGSSSNFKEEYEPFAKQFIADISINWDKSNVIDRMSNSLKEDMSRQEVMENIYQLRGLGQLKGFGDITMENYSTHTNTGEEAIFTLSTDFEAGHALWKIAVNVKDSKARVTGFHLISFDGQMLKTENVIEKST